MPDPAPRPQNSLALTHCWAWICQTGAGGWTSPRCSGAQHLTSGVWQQVYHWVPSGASLHENTKTTVSELEGSLKDQASLLFGTPPK